MIKKDMMSRFFWAILLGICPVVFYILLNLSDNPERKAKFPQIPQRIISLSPSITENLFLLGAGDKLVAVTIYCPADAKNKTKIGTILAPNIEKIVSLKPDLILATSINRPQTINKLTGLGMKVQVLPTEKRFTDIEKNFIILGELVNKKREAVKIIEQIKKEINDIRKKGGTSKPKVFCQIGANPLVTLGKETFIDEMIALAGGVNIAKNTGYFRYSREDVINQNPEVIILVTMGEYTESELKVWQKYKNIQAVEKDRIHIIPADDVCRPTPTAFLEGLKKISEILNKNRRDTENE